MYKYKAKIKELILKILTIIVVLVLIYFGVKFFSAIFPAFEGKEQTQAEIRKEKYNEPTFGDKEIKEKDVDRFLELIDNYYNYCNNKEYEKAYALIHEDCKKKMFPTLEEFKLDVDDKFNKLKRYRYKNLSNVGDNYVYNLTLFDDIVAYGANSMPQEVMYYIVVRDSKDGAKLSLNGYVNTDYTRISSKFEGGIIAITKRDIYYDYVDVTIEITNNTDNVIIIPKSNIIYNIKSNNHIISYGVYSLIMQYSYLYGLPNSTHETKITFKKSFDTNEFVDYEMKFNDIYFISNIYANKAEVAYLLEEDYMEGYLNKVNMVLGL